MSEAPVHSILSPSSSERWLSCTASVYLTRLVKRAKHANTQRDMDSVWADVEYFLPGQDRALFFIQASTWIENPTSIYAEEGTRAHDYAEKILKGKFDPKDLPKGMECVMQYVDICRTLQNRWGGEMWTETRVPLYYFPQERGTIDMALIGGDRLCITDYKHGMGVMVNVEQNPQLTNYAYSVIKHYDEILDCTPSDAVEIRIIQPRIRFGDTEKLWETTVGELAELAIPIKKTADLILGTLDRSRDALELTFCPTESNCQFCDLKPICPVRAKAMMAPLVDTEEIEMTFELMNPEPEKSKLIAASLLSPEQLFKIYQNADHIRKILAEVETTLTGLAMQGNAVEGTKLVMGRKGNRKWTSEKEAADKLLEFIEEDVIWEPQSLVSFATVEKLLKEAQVPKDVIAQIDKGFTTRSEARTVLALSSDKRVAVGNALDDLMAIQDPDAYAD